MAQQTDISKMETTQTAVEWLEEKYHYLLVEADINDMHVVEFDKKRNELFEQAKEMEKQQMKDAVIYGLDEDGHTGDWKISVAENYYIKTYTK